MSGYIQLNRSKNTEELVFKDHSAFVLLTIIALRAKRTEDFSVYNLEVGEALLGDYKNCGFTRQSYREATKRLSFYGFATFRTTNKGTIARLVNTDIFNINQLLNNQPTNQPTTIEQPSNNQPTTTNNNDKNIKNDNNTFINLEKFPTIKITSDEYEKLKTEFPNDYLKRIENLFLYIGSTGKKYKSHYLTILSWSRKEVKRPDSTKSIRDREDIQEWIRTGKR